MAFIISGSLTSSIYLNSVALATMSFYSQSIGGPGYNLVQSASTNTNGQYSESFAGTWSGYSQVTASEFLYSTPTTRSYSVVSTDQNDQDFSLYRYASGTGVSASAFQITTGDEMNMLRHDLGAYYDLAANIDLSGFSNWAPIANQTDDDWFSGSFNGKGYTISNLTQIDWVTINDTPTYGLFGRLDTSAAPRVFTDFTIQSASCQNQSTAGYGTEKWFGIIASLIYRAVSKIHIKDSYIEINPPHNSKITFGGFCGTNTATIYSCSIQDTRVRLVNQSGGSINGYFFGGFVGEIDGAISKCFVNNCKIHLDAGSRNDENSNGFSNNIGAANVTDCYVNDTEVSGATNANVVGFCAQPTNNRVYNSYANTTFYGPDTGSWFPFYDQVFAVVSQSNCYFDSQSAIIISGSPNITGLPTSQMKDSASYNNWDFDGIWLQNDLYNSGYPFFGYDITPKIEGRLLTSLDVAMENVTMSFYASGTDVIDYITYTDANGDYTQSILIDDNVNLVPTASGYELFLALNNSGSFFFSASIFDRTKNWIGVKNFSSGSGHMFNPYIILDYEDTHNIRYRQPTGGVFSEIYHYKLQDDIDLSYFSNWSPIYLTGPIQGNNYTISNMNISITSSIPEGEYGFTSRIAFPSLTSSVNYISDLTFQSCSINLFNATLTSGVYEFGILSGFLTPNSGYGYIHNVHVNNSSVRVRRNTGGYVGSLYIGGLVGSTYSLGSTAVARLDSCSVQNTLLEGSSSTNMIGITVGGFMGVRDNAPPIAINKCFVKDCTVISLSPFGTSQADPFGPTYFDTRDCYALSCSITCADAVGGFIYGAAGSPTRNYCALINYTTTTTKYPFSVPAFDTAGFNYFESGSYIMEPNTTAGVTGSTRAEMKDSASYKTWDFETVWLQDDAKNYGYPYLEYQSFPTAYAGLTLYYDSRLGYLSASNTWTDLSNSGSDATTVYTVPTSSHLYFGTQFGTTSASFTDMLVSQSFGIEIWHAPETSSTSASLFSTVSGTFPRLLGYVTESKVYFGYQGAIAESFSYLSSSAVITPNRFNHIVFYISGTKNELWVNGQFHDSSSVSASSGWTGGTIGIVDTANINPYKGYIDVFKIWNGPIIDTSTVDSYHSLRDYFPELPPVSYPVGPEQQYDYWIKTEDSDGQGIYTSSAFTYGELDVDVFIPSASNPHQSRYIAMYWLVQTNNAIGDFYPDISTIEEHSYEMLVYSPDVYSDPGQEMGARKTYPASPWEWSFIFLSTTNIFLYDVWNTWSIKRNSTENEFFTGGANQIGHYLNGALILTGSFPNLSMGNPSDGTDPPATDSLIYSSSKFMIMQVLSSGSKFRNLRIDGVEQDLSGWTQLPADKFEYVPV